MFLLQFQDGAHFFSVIVIPIIQAGAVLYVRVQLIDSPAKHIGECQTNLQMTSQELRCPSRNERAKILQQSTHLVVSSSAQAAAAACVESSFQDPARLRLCQQAGGVR